MTTESIPAVVLPRGGTYEVDTDRSTVTYYGRHMFGLGAVHATFSIRTGQLHVAETAADSLVRVVIDAASFQSDNGRRDEQVRSRTLLDVQSHPDICFTSKGVREVNGSWVVEGIVTAHGTMVPVAVEVEHVSPEDAGVRVLARARRLDRYAFGVTAWKGMAGRYMDLEFDVFATPVAPTPLTE